ncbi:hypothetical protein ACINWC743_2568 [Acinetobacter sp. WC-743]|nr:hypothetical protein ACINWC743_2568 [Acinetobacter sp. WC-743]
MIMLSCYMKKILKISSFAMFFCAQGMILTQLHAESLKDFETTLIQKYYQNSCTSRNECDQYNENISNAIETKIKKDPASFTYSFPKLTEKNMLKIHYSPDRKIKSYTMDISAGGTMRDSTNLIQLKGKKGPITQDLTTVGFIDKIEQVKIKNRDVYLITSVFIGSTCSRSYRINSFVVNSDKFSPESIFETKTKNLDSIDVANDCQDWERPLEDFIRISKDLKNIDIMLINNAGKLTNNYLRYQKTANSYRYIGQTK